MLVMSRERFSLLSPITVERCAVSRVTVPLLCEMFVPSMVRNWYGFSFLLLGSW